MLSIEAFSELLQILYSAPLEQKQWQRFLTLLSKHTGFATGFFLSADTRSGLAILAQGGHWLDSAFVDTYNRQFAQVDPFRTAVMRRSRSTNSVGVYSEQELVPEEDFLQNALYRELLRPVSLRYAAISILALSVRRFDAISLWGTEDKGPINPHSRNLLELLVPHVQTALKVRRALGTAEQRQASAEAMANASPTATFVLTRDGLVQHYNTAAESLIRGNELLMIENGRLTATRLGDRAAMGKLFHDAVAPSYSFSKPRTSHVLSLDRAEGKQPLQLLATLLPETQRQRSQADLLLLISDPERSASFPDDILHALYGLTPAETEVANGLLMRLPACAAFRPARSASR
jgi:PAS domain-containing protein